MAFGIKQKRKATPKKKVKYEWQVKIGDDVIRAKSKKELEEKLEKGVILWHYPMKGYVGL